MNAFPLILVQFFLHFSESASIPKKNDTLDILKKDVSHVGNAIEEFTFDILREIIANSEEQETTTVEPHRLKRSVEDEVRTLCQKRCNEAQKVETQQIKDLKNEMKKLQEMVRLLQDQEKILDVLDHKNRTEQTRAETESEDESGPNAEELARMKTDLTDVISRLNQTRELMNLQKEKDEILERELINQKEEITKLKALVDTILHNGTISNEDEEPYHSSARASELSGLRKLLKSLPEDEDDGEEELRTKLLDLQKHLDKKRKQKTLLDELKHLEKGFDEDSGANNNNNDLLRQIIAAIKKTEPQSRNDDVNINNLSDLQEAINRLRPKENQADQFQAMLNKLISAPGNQRPQVSVTPPQINDVTKKFAPNGNSPYFCIVNDGAAKGGGYRVPNFPSPPPVDYSRQQQFFPAQYSPPNYYAQGAANGPAFEKPLAYPTETGDYTPKYQEDLKQQIDGLQAAIDNLNKPEYVQRPEDKNVVEDLERQIGDLRNIVTNLNYDSAGYQRGKRSVDNNEIETDKMAEKVTNLVGKLFEKDDGKKQMAEIQTKINTIKKQLDTGNSSAREATTPYYNPLLFPAAEDDPTAKQLTRSFKGDFLSDIIAKIIEKIVDAIPLVLQKLFSFSVEQLSKYDGQDYDVQVLFKNLGVFATIPVILLRIVKGVSAFMNMLRKSSFFKNFLMPALILGTVAGAVLFLIWWLQPDDSSYQQYSGPPPDNPQYPPPNNPTNQYPASYNYPVYSRSYYNK